MTRGKLRCWLCNLFCGPVESSKEAQPGDIPFEIREVSHKIANAATKAQGAARQLEHNAETLRRLASSVSRR